MSFPDSQEKWASCRRTEVKKHMSFKGFRTGLSLFSSLMDHFSYNKGDYVKSRFEVPTYRNDFYRITYQILFNACTKRQIFFSEPNCGFSTSIILLFNISLISDCTFKSWEKFDFRFVNLWMYRNNRCYLTLAVLKKVYVRLLSLWNTWKTVDWDHTKIVWSLSSQAHSCCSQKLNFEHDLRLCSKLRYNDHEDYKNLVDTMINEWPRVSRISKHKPKDNTSTYIIW